MIEIEQMSLLAAQASAELEADIEIAKKSQWFAEKCHFWCEWIKGLL
jgi:hypothetical protein